MTHPFKGGQLVKAKHDIVLKDRFGGERTYATKGEAMIIRCVDPLEVSTLKSPLLAFDVQSDDLLST